MGLWLREMGFKVAIREKVLRLRECFVTYRLHPSTHIPITPAIPHARVGAGRVALSPSGAPGSVRESGSGQKRG